MITIGKKKVSTKPINGELSHDTVWQELLKHLCKYLSGAGGTALQQVERTYLDWVKATTGESLNNRELQSSQNKVYPEESTAYKELALALVHHWEATSNRAAEMNLGFVVVQKLALYEMYILDEAVSSALKRARNLDRQALQGIPDKKNQYSQSIDKIIPNDPLVNELPWFEEDDGSTMLSSLENREPIERLYVKCGAYNSCIQFFIAHKLMARHSRREEHRQDRHNKWTINELSRSVVSEFKPSDSKWAGISGSTMDMIYGAQLMGIKDSSKLTALAWCLFAFYQILPTSSNSTHTFHEVMKGAKRVDSNIEYADNHIVPKLDYLTSKLDRKISKL